MKRRDFLRNSVPAATLLPALIGGFSVKAYAADNPFMQALMGATVETDKVLVLKLDVTQPEQVKACRAAYLAAFRRGEVVDFACR